jgi:uncharacterized membrane protein
MIPYDWTMFVNHVISLIIIILQMGFLKALIINMWQTKILTNGHFPMVDNKKYDVGHLLKFHFKKIGWIIENKH